MAMPEAATQISAPAGSLCKVVAIVQTTVLDRVENRLRALCVPGITVTKVKGYGEYANFYRPDWTVAHVRIEIFLRQERADEVARAIADAGRTGEPGDGIVAIVPVQAVYRVRTGQPATPDELGGR